MPCFCQRTLAARIKRRSQEYKVSRSNKLSGRKRSPEKRPEKILETIFDDVIQTATMPFNDWWASSPSPLVPLAIPVSPGREYRVTQAGVNAAYELTQQTWQAREDFRQTIGREEFNRLSLTAIGETILNSPAHLPKDVEDGETTLVDEAFYVALAADYVDNLNQLADRARPDVDRHIPCHLFHRDQGVPAFSIGPVEFLPRADWIDRFVTDSVERAHIRRVETGALSIDEFRRQALAPGRARDLYNAWSVLSSLRGFAWVATIRMTGHELNQSHQKASTIVGLAIDAIGLRFQVEDARRFTKAGRQHLFAEDRLASSMNGALLRGSSVQMAGLGSKPGALASKMAAERPFLDAVARVLGAYVQGRQTGRAPHLVERWANALYWVGDARREASDFMAVVNYGCAADGLSGAGGDAGTMTNFAEAALNPKGDPTPAGSLSIADAVTAVYREGRNKLAHGEMSGLLEDLAETRTIGDALLVNLFDAVTPELANIISNRPQILALDEKHAYRAFQERLRQRP
jgi:hypothetical protein